MDGFKDTSCRLCLKPITGTSFEIIGDVTKQILDILLLELKFDEKKKEVICDTCRNKLNAALEFKSTCLDTDNTIASHVSSEKMLELDLKEVYIKENANDGMDISYCYKICQLCMQLAKNEFRCIREEELDAIQKLIPEMNITTIKDSIICKPCFDSLCVHNNFLNSCLEVEKIIKNIGNSATDVKVDISAISLLNTTDSLDREIEINEIEMVIKEECVDIKSEDDEESKMPLSNLNVERVENCMHKDAEMERYEIKCTSEKDGKSKNYRCYLEPREQSNVKIYHFQLRHKTQLQVKMHTCDDCDFKTICKGHFNEHRLRHRYNLNIKKSYKCAYENIKPKFLPRHQLVHKLNQLTKHKLEPNRFSGAQMYKSNMCECTGYSASIDVHQQLQHKNLPSHPLQHLDFPDAQRYKCYICNFETQDKIILECHMIRHIPLQAQMYRCDSCNYYTQEKTDFKHHLLKHVVSSKMQTFKCNSYISETETEMDPKRHPFKHRSPSQARMHKCIMCDYETNDETSFESHQLQHESFSKPVSKHDYQFHYKNYCLKRFEVPKYKCDVCNFGSEYEHSLKYHMSTHQIPSTTQIYKGDCETKNTSEVEFHTLNSELSLPNTQKSIKEKKESVYKCKQCVYQTDCEVKLISHILGHGYTEVQRHKCDSCCYSSKDMGKLQDHLLKHECSSEVRSYKCEMCDTETLHMYQLQRRNPWEVQTKKCNVCGFETSAILKINVDATNVQP